MQFSFYTNWSKIILCIFSLMTTSIWATSNSDDRDFLNMRIVSDLQKQFGDLKQLQIVEVGGGGELCAVLAKTIDFASYTIVSSSESNDLARKFLAPLGIDNVNFIDKDSLSEELESDLLISDCFFSESDVEEQRRYMKYLLAGAANGFMRIDPLSEQFLIEYLSVLIRHGKKGKVQLEHPEFPIQTLHTVLRNEQVKQHKHNDIQLLTWHHDNSVASSIIKKRKTLPKFCFSNSGKQRSLLYL